jgi:dihydrolipoamide dehydrogenase
MSKNYDVVIVGAGTAGLAALREVRKRTDNFVIINDGPWGTVCARVGCMPSKALIEAANAFHRRTSFDEFGIRGTESLTIDIAAALRRVRRLRDGFVSSTLKATSDLGDRAISGRARLLGVGKLEVNGRILHANSIVLATGSRPVMPERWRALGGKLLTTDSLFEQESLPPRMAVLGMGPVGVEMAQALSRLGIDITAFSKNKNIARLSDPEVNAAAIRLLGEEFSLQMGEKADLHMDSNQLRVSTKTTEVACGGVLVALGRRPNIDGLGLETLGMEIDEHGLPPVDPYTMQIADLPVFLAGDANQQAPILHEAADEGHIAGINALHPKPFSFRRRTPLAIVFSEPGIATVGKRFESLDSRQILIGTACFETQARARMAQRNHGILRLYAQRENGKLLGAEMVVPAAEHMAHLLAVAIDRSLTVQDMLRLPFYHPTLEEGLRTALRKISSQLPPCGESDLAGCEPLHAEALE